MTERQFRLIIWSALIQAVRAIGKYWQLCDDIKVIKRSAPGLLVIVSDGDSIAGATYTE